MHLFGLYVVDSQYLLSILKNSFWSTLPFLKSHHCLMLTYYVIDHHLPVQFQIQKAVFSHYFKTRKLNSRLRNKTKAKTIQGVIFQEVLLFLKENFFLDTLYASCFLYCQKNDITLVFRLKNTPISIERLILNRYCNHCISAKLFQKYWNKNAI